MHINAKSNEYADVLGRLLDHAPKTVIAAIAVSLLSQGGDHMEDVPAKFVREWSILNQNGIVPQKPPKKVLGELAAMQRATK